jgi:NADPH-dependent curcumin reductase CurA
MSDKVSREIHLKAYPVGRAKERDFELVEVPVPQPAEGQYLVRNIYMTVDPYMRGRMTRRKGYSPGFELGQPMGGGCVGQVLESKGGSFKAGDYVVGFHGWREYFVSDGSDLEKIDPAVVPIQSYLGAMGMPGRTAYVGLFDIGKPKKGETVFVSAASGAVGSVACQIAKILGCRVVGSAGSAAKVEWLLKEAGVDAAFNYKEVDDLASELDKHCPNGIDVYYDNVGGPTLEAALSKMNMHGRIVMCGMISEYSLSEPQPGPRNLSLAVGRRLTLRGFIQSDHADRFGQFHSDMVRWIAEGRMKWKETIWEGIEKAPGAFIALFTGENFGKMLVKIGPDPAV